MVTVSYAYQFGYIRDLQGEPHPGFPLRIANPHHPDQAVDVNAYLDSGAQRSLFQGWILKSIGLDLLDGPPKLYKSVLGFTIEGRLHLVRLSLPDLGDFAIEIGFSTGEISRNLLGRDFFDLVQIGFRERYLSFYVTPTP